jgi:predicted O-linked N-acetylglucosamine transferase (SPINDLY family)
VQTSVSPLNIASLASLAHCEGDTASLNASLAKPSEASSEATSEAVTLTGKRSEASEAISSPFAEVCNLIAQFTDAERQKLVELLTQPQPLPAQVTPKEFAEQIRKAIADFDRPLANQILNVLKDKAKEKLREEVKSHLTSRENENFRLLVVAGFLLDMPVKYVGDSKYAEQYEGLELQVYSMDKFFQITCRKPDGYLTTRMKPEELQKL